MTTTLFAGARLPDGSLADVTVTGDRIAAVGAAGASEPDAGTRVIDCAGWLLAPSFCEGHIHLDKTLLGTPFTAHRRGATVADRIAAEKAIRRELAVPVFERGACLVEKVVAHGTGALRTHVDIDSEIGLANLHEVLRLREAFGHLLDMQVVAFPQSGIVRDPGVADLLDAALAEGATHIGGLDPVGIDGAMTEHLDTVFGLAEKHGVGIDIHLHDGGVTGLAELTDIAERTAAAGLEGRVVVSHAFALGGPEDIGPTVEALARAGVAILTHGPGTATMPPVVRLWEAGVKVLAGNDNIRDAWSPYGNGDMLKRAMMIGYRQGMNADEELSLLFRMVTHDTAATMGFGAHAMAVGELADLVLIEAPTVALAVVEHPPRALVMKRGRIVAQNGTLSR